MKIAFLVQGLFEKSDSIGYDCVYEYRRARLMFQAGDDDVRIFAERFNVARHPTIPIEDLDAFYRWCDKNPDGVVIYHYCGAWLKMDSFLSSRPGKSVIRWHNNTPPWFFFSKEIYLEHTVEGFENIVNIIDKPNLFFWVNSVFTRDQFVVLGGQAARSAVVFPASRYLEKAGAVNVKLRRFAADGVINMLFVGRVVPHKGHKSIISVAERVHKVTQKPVIVRFAGREDDIKANIEHYAQDIAGVETHFYGEVNEAELEELYNISDVFMCLSEHEGFGLPVFEAMRCGLPTITWSTTALRELMIDHPLGFHYYDLNMFAAAILSLRDPAVHQSVIDAQERVLETYTVEVVDGQIRDALHALHDKKGKALAAVLPNKLQCEPELAAPVMTYMARAVDVTGITTAFDRDTGYNLFSRYDIETFRLLMDRINRLRFAAFENFTNNGRHRIEAGGFTAPNSIRHANSLHYPVGHYGTDHLFFGPYVVLPSAKYVTEFDIALIEHTTPIVEVEVDIASRKRGTLAEGRFEIGRPNAAIPKLTFDNADDDDEIEFRARFCHDYTGGMIFNGVLIAQAR